MIGVKAAASAWAGAALLALAGCQAGVAPPSPPASPPGRLAAPAPAPEPESRLSLLAPAPRVVLPTMDLAPGPIYHCELGGARSVLTLPDNIEALCRRHPEMGPCQYERDSCRRRGGRVLTSRGEEVTAAVEAEYDKRVHRVRFQADGTGPR